MGGIIGGEVRQRLGHLGRGVPLRWALFGLIAAGLLMGEAAPAPAAPISALEVAVASEAPGVTDAEAKEDLAVQHQATRVDLVEQLGEQLGEQYAGVWFDG